ncbi:MAG: ATP-binding protein [Candidatus Omnitrophota bacterium]
MKIKFGISEKIIAMVAVLTAILTIGSGYYSFKRQREILLQEFDEKAQILVNSLASGSEYSVLTGNDKLLNSIASAALKYKDVIFCEVKDKDGRVLFTKGGRDKKYIRSYVGSILTERVAGSPDEMIFSGSQGMKMERIGEVCLAFSLTDLMEKMGMIKNDIIVLTLVGIIIILVFVTLLVKFILGRPIKELIMGTERISSGDLSYKVSIKGKDEIGELAAAFNKMTGDLQKITVSRDELMKEVTERQRAEGSLKIAYEKLKQTETQLIQSAKMASIGQLAGGVAHEINNPLTGVLNNVQLIRMEAESRAQFSVDDFKELLSVIEESALRCKRITQSLLDFSRASARSFQPLSLNELTGKVIVLISHEMQLQNIFIRTELEPNLPLISGDPQLLQQVIFDIISNAKWAIEKKSGKGGGKIVIRTSYDHDIKQVTLSISDTGIGISKENIGKVFDPFFTTKSVGEGTGLGLSIVYSIIKEHMGNIRIESEPEKGTVFTIELPVLEKAGT